MERFRNKASAKFFLLTTFSAIAGFLSINVFAPAASANTSVASSAATVSLSMSDSNPTGRTLVLYNASHVALSGSNSIDMSGGSGIFTAEVQDNNYANNSFVVEAQMSNLYANNSGTWSCGTSVPSSDVSLSVPSTSLDIDGLSVSITPTYLLSGGVGSVLGLLSSLITGSGSATLASQPAVGLATALTQNQLVATAGELVGASNGSLLGLPVQLSLPSSPTPFTSAGTPPSGSSCTGGSDGTATQVTLLSGTSNAAGLLQTGSTPGPLQTQLNTLANEKGSSLISGGYLSQSSLLSAVSTVTGIGTGLLSGVSGLSTAVTGALDTVTNTATISQSGNYSVSPTLALNTTVAGSGTFDGTMTVTLMDTP